MKVLIAASEAVPFVKTGGLADVAGTLLNELRSSGIDSRLALPLYRGIKSRFKLEDSGRTVSVPLGKNKYESRVFSYEDTAYLFECDEFFNRQDIYGSSGGDYEDNAQRFIFFSRAVLEACAALKMRPDIIHANDWQTALIPLYMKTLYKDVFRKTSSVFTIHNLGYQGIFPADTMKIMGLGDELFTPFGVEFYGQVNLLKAGIIAADAITTVSPNYAEQILTEEYGAGLDGVLKDRKKDMLGILNGLDYEEWDPDADNAIPAKFSLESLQGKRKCKRGLIKECAFKNPRAPIAGIVGRLSSQKGMDLFIEASDEIFSSGLNVAIIGKGDEIIRKDLKAVEKKYPGRLFVNIGFDEALARRIYAGADMLLMPSYYEPCGLVQMIAMRYGTVPVARATGGLTDTIADYNHLKGTGTGFLFSGRWPSALAECVKRALCVFTDVDRWDSLVRRCMKERFLWSKSSRRYVNLYRKLKRQVRE